MSGMILAAAGCCCDEQGVPILCGQVDLATCPSSFVVAGHFRAEATVMCFGVPEIAWVEFETESTFSNQPNGNNLTFVSGTLLYARQRRIAGGGVNPCTIQFLEVLNRPINPQFNGTGSSNNIAPFASITVSFSCAPGAGGTPPLARWLFIARLALPGQLPVPFVDNTAFRNPISPCGIIGPYSNGNPPFPSNFGTVTINDVIVA